MTTAATTSPARAAWRNRDLVRHELAFLTSVTAEWMVFLGVLVAAFERNGATATGIASVALLLPYALCGPFAGTLASRYPPQLVRVTGFAVQAAGYGVAALAIARDLPTAAVVAPAAVAIGAVTTIRPTGAGVLPGIVRSSRELTVGNLWNGWCENLGALGGPLLGGALLAVGGPSAVLAGCAVLTLISVAVSLLPRPINPPASDPDRAVRTWHVVSNALAQLRRRGGALAVLILTGSQFFVIGALDIIVVVAAEDELDLGPGGPGWLLTALGLGGVVSVVVAGRLANRRRQSHSLIAALVVLVVASLALAGFLSPVAAFLILPVMGLARSLIDVLGDVLLHRSAPPAVLGAVYALLEFSAGAGLIAGSLVTQAAIAVSGTRLALVGVGVFFLVQLLTMSRALRRADDGADVPVVAMSLLPRVPLFAPLPQAALEDVARAGVELDTEPGETLIVEGDAGDRFYVVADGTFDVSIGGHQVASIGRGGSFGEIALIADVPRTATVTARTRGAVVGIDRRPFLVAVLGHDGSRQTAWNMSQRHGHLADDVEFVTELEAEPEFESGD
jgi:MFS family permease